MFSKLFNKIKENTATQIIKFSEEYCHSAGNENAKIYQLKKDTSEVVFDFGSVDKFLDTYFYGNSHLPKDVVSAVKNKKAFILVQLIQGKDIFLYDGDLEDRIIFNSKTLSSTKDKKEFRSFNEGVIAIGIYNRESFGVLWATMYKAI